MDGLGLRVEEGERKGIRYNIDQIDMRLYTYDMLGTYCM